MDVGSAALMRGYMERAGDVHFPLHRKIDRFLTAALRIYCVGEEEIREVLDFDKNGNPNHLLVITIPQSSEFRVNQQDDAYYRMSV